MSAKYGHIPINDDVDDVDDNNGTREKKGIMVKDSASMQKNLVGAINQDHNTNNGDDNDDIIIMDDIDDDVDDEHQPLEGNNHDNDSEDYDDENNITTITIDEAIERLGMGKFQITILFAAGMCFAADAMQVLLLSFLSVVLQNDWELSDHRAESITSILFFGAFFGTLILGPLADCFGRKPIFILSASIIAFFGIATSFAFDYIQLLIMIGLVGFGVGGLTVPFDVLAEMLPSEARGKNLLLIEYFWTVGVLLVVVLAYWTLHQDDGNWRLFCILCSIPCCISVVIGMLYVPESPRWLCTQQRTTEALAIVRHAAKINGHDPDALFPLETTRLAPEEKESSDFCALFQPQWINITACLWGAWGAFAFGYYGTIMVTTEIFATEEKQQQQQQQLNNSGDNSFFSSEQQEQDDFDFDYVAIFISSFAELLGITFVIFFVEKAGRIPLQMIAYSIAGISVCLLCVMASNPTTPRNLLISLGFIARSFEMAGSCVSWVSTAEILTTEVRTTGHSAANAVARLGGLVSPFVLEGDGPLIRKGLVMLSIHAFTVFCISFLPETRGRGMGVTDDNNNDNPEHVSIVRSEADAESSLVSNNSQERVIT